MTIELCSGFKGKCKIPVALNFSKISSDRRHVAPLRSKAAAIRLLVADFPSIDVSIIRLLRLNSRLSPLSKYSKEILPKGYPLFSVVPFLVLPLRTNPTPKFGLNT